MNVYSSFVFVVIFCLEYYMCGDVDLLSGFRMIQMGPKTLWNETNLDKLKKDLFVNYDRYSRPHEYFNVTKISFEFVVIFIETKELKSTVTYDGMLRLVWDDPKLKWNESDYDGISVIRIADHEIWQPDVYLYNSAKGAEPIVRYGNPNVLVYPSGEVLWVPPTKLTAFCNFNLRHWPFDTQHCNLEFGSWTHYGYEIELKLYNNHRNISIEDIAHYGAWDITNSIVKITNSSNSNSNNCRIVYNLTLARKSEIYKTIILTPGVVNAILILLQFWLPPQSREKLILNCFVVLTLTTLLMYFTNQICSTGSKTPLIVLFYSCSLLMVCLAMLGDVIGVWLSKNKRVQSIMHSVHARLPRKLGNCLLLELKFKQVGITTQETPRKSQNRRFLGLESTHISEYKKLKLDSAQYAQDECIISVLINRILFMIYTLIFIIFGIVYLC